MDSKDKNDYRDRDRINKNEDYEVQYWSEKFGVTKQELIYALEKVGPMVKDVEAALKK